MNSGERFLPHDSNPSEVLINLDRYVFAASCVQDKIVCDIGFGSGLGTYLYSLVAKQVYAYDYSDEAFFERKKFPIGDNVKFYKQDLEKDFELQKCDTIIALEVLEHLEDPVSFLKAQTARYIIFSLPINSLPVSKWHKFDIRSQIDVENMFIDGGYKVENINTQSDLWLCGKAKKFN